MKPNFPCSGSDRYSTETDTARWPLAGSPSVESCRTPRHRGRRGGGDRRRLSRGETQNPIWIGTPLKLILPVGPSRVHRPLRVAALPVTEVAAVVVTAGGFPVVKLKIAPYR